jgi:hypothetical protein
MQEFFKGKLKKKTAPLPSNCGCYAFRTQNPLRDSFVCANINGEYLLMIVLQYENEIVTVYDPTDVDNGIKGIDLRKDQWTPLPTMLPEKPIKRWEHAKDCIVLSLWPNGDGQWTTEFYKAIVRKQPCERPETEERGYELEFEGNKTVAVPEAFVVTFPEEWKKKEEAEKL